MARSNVDAIYVENPLLKKFVLRAKVSDAQVKRWNEEFLHTRPDSYPESGTEKIYLVDEHGDIITRVGTRWEQFLTSLGFTISETVGQTLARVGDDQARRVKYAVGVWHRVILWKLPNGYDNAADWLNSRSAEDREQIRQL
ncbi:MAG: hypothetical protein G01um101491_240 [Parcubacteria group bacterium Gr01-1014_91]|nr:MAG: hypothetical protein G01um101491_240 [Parcubacteria group bacterium Gr01-1014_91]